MRIFLNKNPGSAAQLSFVVQTPAVASSSSNNHELLCSRVGERFAKGLREFLALCVVYTSCVIAPFTVSQLQFDCI